MMSLCHFGTEGNDEAAPHPSGFDTDGRSDKAVRTTGYGSGPSRKPFCLRPI